MSESSTSVSALIICATRAARRSLSPKRISAVATVSFSLMTGTAPSARSCSIVARALRCRRRSSVSSGVSRIWATVMPCRRQRFVIGMRQADLPGGGRGLLLLELERASGEAEMAAADRDRARRDDQHLLAACPAAHDVLDQAPSSQARRMSPVASSTSRAEPILTMSRRAAARLWLMCAAAGVASLCNRILIPVPSPASRDGQTHPRQYSGPLSPISRDETSAPGGRTDDQRPGCQVMRTSRPMVIQRGVKPSAPCA